jgi:hypothetical protein
MAAGDRLIEPWDALITRLVALQATGQSLAYVRHLFAGDRDAPTTDMAPFIWIFFDRDPAILENWVASSRLRHSEINLVLKLVRDGPREKANNLYPYGVLAGAGTRKEGMGFMVADVMNALASVSWPAYVKRYTSEVRTLGPSEEKL